MSNVTANKAFSGKPIELYRFPEEFAAFRALLQPFKFAGMTFEMAS